ncbi:hypothetical protein AgCh_036261 [Apium graveolens]
MSRGVLCVWAKKRNKRMLSRKPSKIQLKLEDKDEIEEARKQAAAAAATTATTTTGASSLLHHFDRSSKDSSSKNSRIGLSS